MWRKLFLSLLALVLMAAANLQLCCELSFPGMREGLSLSPEQLRRGQLAARMAAEEVLPGPVQLPEPELSYSLSLKAAKGSSKELSAALLERTAGISLGQGVYIQGCDLGTVESADQLRRDLRDHIHAQLPSWAVSGHLTEELSFKARYTRTEKLTPDDDMVLLITGMAPVMYSDGEGYMARA